jgi:phosphatidate cytidylyltransferase
MLKSSETLTRALSGLVYVVLLVVGTLYSFESFFFLFGVFLALCVFEFCLILGIRPHLYILLSLALYYVNAQLDIVYQNLIICILALITSYKAIYYLFNLNNNTLKKHNRYIYLIGYLVNPFLILPELIKLPHQSFNPKIIIGIFVLLWVNDTFAYLIGKNFGKHKLFEKVSPKKTIEGFVGGFIFTIIASFIISYFFDFLSPFEWFIIALIVGIFGNLGDLIESKFKRIAGVKDSGKIMPGHGGLLDRLDSFIFVVPYTFIYLKILPYVS